MVRQILVLVCVLAFAGPASAQTIDLQALEKIRDAIDEVLETRVVAVTTSEQLHAALKDARAGDIIEVRPGYYDGAFRLPKFAGDRPVTLRVTSDLPDRMMDLPDVWRLAVLRSTSAGAAALQTEPGAKHWRLDGIAFTQTGGNTFGIVKLGGANGFASPDEIPSDITIDRSVVWVDGETQERRGIQCNAADVTIRRTSILNIKEAGNEAQALACWDSPGPLLVEDSVLEAAGENFMAGGSDPSIVGMTPTDLTFRRVLFRKPLAWRGSKWTVKNIFELKHARRVTVEDSTFDGIWAAAQNGFAIVLTPRNQGGKCTWCIVEDVTFDRFTVKNAGSAFNLLGSDDIFPSQSMSKVTIRNGLLLLDGKGLGSDGRALQLIDGRLSQVVFDHNTVIADGSFLTLDSAGRGKMRGIVITNNVAKHNLYGVIGTGVAPGNPSLSAFLDNGIFLKNVLAGAAQAGYSYPATNLVPTVTTFNAQFNPDWTLKPTSTWKNAGTDGKDLGASLP